MLPRLPVAACLLAAYISPVAAEKKDPHPAAALLLGDWTESVTPLKTIEREFALTLVPGVRHAMDIWGGLVLGLAVPVTIVDRKADYHALLLVSFEHSFTR